jgi:hypothetical protein
MQKLRSLGTGVGSSLTKSAKPHLPLISGAPHGGEHINAAIQRRYSAGSPTAALVHASAVS